MGPWAGAHYVGATTAMFCHRKLIDLEAIAQPETGIIRSKPSDDRHVPFGGFTGDGAEQRIGAIDINAIKTGQMFRDPSQAVFLKVAFVPIIVWAWEQAEDGNFAAKTKFGPARMPTSRQHGDIHVGSFHDLRLVKQTKARVVGKRPKPSRYKKDSRPPHWLMHLLRINARYWHVFVDLILRVPRQKVDCDRDPNNQGHTQRRTRSVFRRQHSRALRRPHFAPVYLERQRF